LRIRSAGSINGANDRLMMGLLAYLKRTLWRFVSLLIGRGTNRTAKIQNSILLRTDFSPTPLAPTKCSAVEYSRCWLGHCNKRTFNCGLACVPAACLAEVYFSVVQILNSNGLNG